MKLKSQTPKTSADQTAQQLNLPGVAIADGAIDCHAHLADPRIHACDKSSDATNTHRIRECEISTATVAKWLEENRHHGIAAVMQGGVDPEDWQRQLDLALRFPNQILPCFGLHPYFVAQNETAKCEQALALLESLLPKSWALGELGLDFRSQFGRREHQVDFFMRQLHLARDHQKVAVFHFVRAHAEAIRILKTQPLHRGGIVHSFNSDKKTATSYLDLGFMLSIGGPALYPGNAQLLDSIAMIPIERLLLESDSPDQPPPEMAHHLNRPMSIILVAKKIGEVKKLSTKDILLETRRNFERLFEVEIGHGNKVSGDTNKRAQ